jgi:peptidyl-dipeptidase Dcp
MPKEIVLRHRLPQFNHLFSSDSYSAGYYSYLWSETMDADTWAAFTQRALGRIDGCARLRQCLRAPTRVTNCSSGIHQCIDKLLPPVVRQMRIRGSPEPGP